MMTPVSVIICTHNPRLDFLAQVLANLRAQTLPTDQWELVVIDNASREPLAGRLDLAWHPTARVVREDEVGLVAARLRGVAESAGDLLVWVDDDNVLEPDYLEAALRISRERPTLGAWSGAVLPHFEVPPPEWTRPYWGNLCIRELTTEIHVTTPEPSSVLPSGAGMCIRRSIAARYASVCKADPRRLKLGRKGALLLSMEDADMALTSFDMGYTAALLPALSMKHLIPPGRLTEDYLARTAEGLYYSIAILWHGRGWPAPPVLPAWRTWLARVRLWFMLDRHQRRMVWAIRNGTQKAARDLAVLEKQSTCPPQQKETLTKIGCSE